MTEVKTDSADAPDAQFNADDGALLGTILVVLIIIAAAAALAYYMLVNPAKTEKTGAESQSAALVETIAAEQSNHPIVVEVMGQVMPARQAILKAQVSGEVISVSEQFAPGGYFKQDEEILRIDPSDYELDVKVRKASVRQSVASLRLEMGQQAIAKDELKILEKSTGKKLKSSDLALRKPQLEQARADHDSAKANLELAELNLKRTILSAPFNALITERNTNIGNVIGTQDTLATLVGTDEYWIEAEIPVQHLRWLSIPKAATDSGTKAMIELDGGRGERQGHLLRTNGSVDTQTRLAGILISVPDPLALQSDKMQPQFPLILGDYVKVSLIGKELKNIVRIPQSYIRDGNTIWIEKNRKLVIRPVTIVYLDRQYAYITEGISNGERIITSNIITPVVDMALRLPEDDKAVAKPTTNNDEMKQDK